MMRKFAQAFGVGFLLAGVLTFVPGVTDNGFLMRVFAVDFLHGLVYLVSGALAFAALRYGSRYVRTYFKLLGLVYLALALAGFLDGETIFGLMITNAAGNVLHLLLALVALWVGFGAHDPARTHARRSA